MKLLKYIFLVVGLMSLGLQESKAQVDTTFWFAAPWVTPDHDHRDPIAFHIATFNNPTTVRIQQPSSTYDTLINIGPNTQFSKWVHFMMDSLECKPADLVHTHGFKISSDFPITVVYDVVTRGPSSNNPETYSLKGQNGLGTEFILPFQTLWDTKTLPGDFNGDGTITQPYQQFNVVAAEDSTTLYITPRCPIVGHPANVTFSVFLPKAGNTWTGQNVTQATSVLGNNLSGTVVVSDKKVAVTVSDDSVNPSGGGGCYDLMGDQIVPTDVVGNEYIVNLGFLNPGSNESAFIVATENFTSVSIDNGITVTNTILNQGDTYQYSLTEALTYINSDKPVYVWHMSGYGCEMGEAILPPLNCAGSNEVNFSRSTPVSFLLNILCPAGSEGNFTLNGSTTLVTAGMFNPVPGTGGAWVGAQISFNTTDVPVGTASSITNSTDLFSLGIINGSATGGCLYHYMSSFIRRVYTKAGNDTTLCNGEPVVNLNGSVTGGATTGVWSVLNGTGTLNTPTNLVTTYAPSASDYSQGSLTFVLGSTGNCDPVYDTMVVDFIQSPVVTAGPDDTYCKNNVGNVPINGTLSYAAGASWSGGNGGAFGNSGSLSTFYTPSPADLAADSVALFITSAGSLNSCPNDEDTVVIYFTDPATVIAGPDQVVCSSDPDVNLVGSITGVTTTGIWSTTGSGAFSPSGNQLTTDYLVSSADTASGTVTLTLTSTSNANCLAVQDSLVVTIIDKPEVLITTSDSLCSNLSAINLTGTVTTGFSTNWVVNGAGSIVAPGSLNTTYNMSPLDTTSGFIDIFLSTTGGICPVEQDSLRITFIDPPSVNAGLDQAFCNNEPIELNGAVGGANSTVSWSSTGTGVFNPSTAILSTFYFPSALDVANGGVNLILTSSGDYGCIPTNDTLEVTFKDSPVADFTFTESCDGQNTTFTDLSTTSDGTINSWTYDFGDFTSSISQNPSHLFQASGTYTTSLIAGSTNGCYDTTEYTVTVHPNPIAQFTNGIACLNLPTDFEDQSFVASGSIVAWDYDFNNGEGSSTDQDPSYSFLTSGGVSVTLQVTSDQGCVGTVTNVVNVLPGPNAGLSVTPNPALALEDVFYTDQSTGNQLTNWYWDFGDESGGNQQNEIHNYADGGDYTVTLTVTDIDGCIDTAQVDLTIALLPVLPSAFTPNGDGENDEFIIRGGPFNAANLKIYNNWGELIFESDDPDVGWDGTYKGTEAPLGVYTWTFQVEVIGGRIVSKSGDVTLMR